MIKRLLSLPYYDSGPFGKFSVAEIAEVTLKSEGKRLLYVAGRTSNFLVANLTSYESHPTLDSGRFLEGTNNFDLEDICDYVRVKRISRRRK